MKQKKMEKCFMEKEYKGCVSPENALRALINREQLIIWGHNLTNQTT